MLIVYVLILNLSGITKYNVQISTNDTPPFGIGENRLNCDWL